MDLSESWIPSLDGEALPPCAEISHLVDLDIRPDPRKESEADWTLKGLNAELKGVHLEAKRALLECVVGVWRLREKQEQGEDNEEWKIHLVAWLARHRSICQDRDIRPLQVLVQFSKTARTKGWIPAHRRSLIFDDLDLAPQIETLGEDDIEGSDREFSIETSDADGTDSDDQPIIKRGRRKGRMVQSEDDASSQGITGNKRSSSNTFDRVSAKRTRMTQDSGKQLIRSSGNKRNSKTTTSERCKVITDPNGVDLSEITVEKGSCADPTLVPSMPDKATCTRCQERGTKCHPVWHLYGGKCPSILCIECLRDHKGCSFIKMRWRIKQWPEIEENGSGNPRKVPNIATRKGSGPLKDFRDLQRSRSGSESSTVSVHHPVIRSHDRHEIPSSSRTFGASSGRTAVFESLVPFEGILKDPGRSPISLNEAAIELRSLTTREEGELRTFAETVTHRRELINPLIVALVAEGKKLKEVDENANEVDANDTADLEELA